MAASGGLLAATGVLGFDRLVLIVSFGLQVLFAAYFVRHLAFAVSAIRGMHRPPPAMVDPDFHPRVSVLVACRDEEAVLPTLFAALARLRYPHPWIEFVLIDDGSEDRTSALMHEFALRDRRVVLVHRDRSCAGAKPAALNAGLRRAGGDVVVVFDADHEPHPDVITMLVRHFDDPAVGAVQGRCVIRNPDDSLLSRLVWIDYLAGYLVNEYGRQSLTGLPAYGGANCAVRMSVIRAVGGWNERSVTEDTDLTIRLLLRGVRVRYEGLAIDREEGVDSLRRFWHQRYRWARGHQQVCRDHRRDVWRSSRFSVTDKIELTMFLFLFHMPVLSGVGFVIFTLWMAGIAAPFNDTHGFIFWTLLFLGPMLELGAGLLIAQAPRRAARSLVFFLPIYFVSIALCTRAWWDGVWIRPYEWSKTPRSSDVEVHA